MKRSIAVLFIALFLLAAILAGCSDAAKLEEAMEAYSKIVAGDLPENLKLTIYYVDPQILTRYPWSKEDLVRCCDLVITVESEELAPYWELMKSLKPSILKPTQEEEYINARVYYYLEVGNSEKILEVVISYIHGSVYVNGIQVEDHPVFYELIVDFLAEEGITIPGL